MSDAALVSAWSDFRAAIAARAPVSDSLIAAPSSDPSALTQALGLINDDIVQTWFSLHDGAGFDFDGSMIFPLNFVLSQQRAIDETAMIREIWADGVAGETEATSGDLDVAGQIVGTWLPSYVMIGTDTTGGGYFLDLRPGPLHGCVRNWDKVNSDAAELVAPSLATLLATLTESLTTGNNYKYWKPSITNGWLDWKIDEATL